MLYGRGRDAEGEESIGVRGPWSRTRYETNPADLMGRARGVRGGWRRLRDEEYCRVEIVRDPTRSSAGKIPSGGGRQGRQAGGDVASWRS